MNTYKIKQFIRQYFPIALMVLGIYTAFQWYQKGYVGRTFNKLIGKKSYSSYSYNAPRRHNSRGRGRRYYPRRHHRRHHRRRHR